MKNFTINYLKESKLIIDRIDIRKINKVVEIIYNVKKKFGRIFFIGVGGSAANCSHAVNDFRKIAGIESYTPTDNVAELTARTNDEGWESVFKEWLKISKLKSKDLIFIFSVGGGNKEKNISRNLIEAIKYSKSIGSKIVGVVGRDGGFAARNADECIIIPTVNKNHITPHTEGFQALVWHLIVTHPKLKKNTTKWESIKK